MTLTINSVALNKALKQLLPAISTNRIIPILDNIHLKGTGGSCDITATNTNITITVNVDCENTEDFEMLLPFKQMLNITSVCSEILTIKSNKVIEVISLKETYKLGKTEDAENYPKQEQVKTLFSFEADSEFLNALQLSKRCVHKEHVFAQYKDVSIDGDESGEVKITSTDLAQMFRYKQDTGNKVNFRTLVDPSFIIAANGLNAATISGSDKFLKLSTPTTTITITLSEQKYPDCDRLFIHEKGNCELSKDDLSDAVNRMMVFDDKLYVLKLDIKKGNTKLTYDNVEMGQHFDTDIKTKNEIDINECYLNGSILKNLLSLIPSDEDTLYLTFINSKENVHINTNNKNLNLIIRPIVY